MGFAAPAAADYQVGVISLGEDPPELVSPLQPLSQSRDALARAISAPAPMLATQIVPALEMAYRELRESPQRRPGNQPAVVLLTDGAPYPAAGQSNEDIERLVAANPDVPLFVILLQNPERPVADYENYILF
jgi:Mg-chelatase subunit ChlD